MSLMSTTCVSSSDGSQCWSGESRKLEAWWRLKHGRVHDSVASLQTADEGRPEPPPQAARSGPPNVDAPRAATATRSTGSAGAPLRRSMRRSSASARSAGSNKRPSLSDPTTNREDAAAAGGELPVTYESK